MASENDKLTRHPEGGSGNGKPILSVRLNDISLYKWTYKQSDGMKIHKNRM